VREFLIFCAIKLAQKRVYEAQDLLYQKGEWALFEYKGYKVLIIDGTRSCKEWASNFRKGGWVEATEKLEADYIEECGTDFPDYIVGYSRGAVLGLMLAEKWRKKCLCFSSPKVSWSQLKLAQIPLFLELERDIVAWIPPLYVRPTPLILLKVRGWKHSVIKIEEIPDWKLKLLEKSWGFP
jgi:hypothetical protein